MQGGKITFLIFSHNIHYRLFSHLYYALIITDFCIRTATSIFQPQPFAFARELSELPAKHFGIRYPKFGAAMFLTFHLKPRVPLFGRMVGDRMDYSPVGMIARRVLARGAGLNWAFW